ncbi:MAG: tyrosine-type recombinase/integrase [Candidatus Sulfotelmatobacter sp.]
MEKAVDDWLEEREKDGIHNRKAKLLSKNLIAWCQRQGIRYLGEIQKQDLRVWRTNEWKYANGDSASMKVHSSILGNFFQWCVDGDLLESSPWPKLKGKIQLKEVVPFTPQEIDLLIHTAANMPKWDVAQRVKMRAFISLMAESGMAIGDAATLEVVRVVGLVISGKRRKTKKRFSVPIPQSLADFLHSLTNNDPKFFFWHRRPDGNEVKEDNIVHTYGEWFRMVCDAAGMPEGHSHQLRHSFATYHIARGVDPARVAEWMGDDPAQVRKTYEHWIPERDAQSLAAMVESWKQQGRDEVGNQKTLAIGAVN